MLLRYQPFVTKGPWAIFFGDPKVVMLLPSSKSKLWNIFLLGSLLFNISLKIFKNSQFRKRSLYENFNLIIVGNLLNLMTVSKIIFTIFGFFLLSALHFIIGRHYFSKNYMASFINTQNYIIFNTLIMTSIQLYPFVFNPALRYHV